MAKEGSTIGGLMDVIGTETSMGLQYGVPLEVLVEKFSHSRFEPSGWTPNPDIPNAKSVVDYIFRFLGIQFLPGFREANAPRRSESADHGEDEDSGESHQMAEVAVIKATQPAASAPGTNGHTSNGHATNGHSTNGHHATNGHSNGKTPVAIAQRMTSSLKTLQPAGTAAETSVNRNQQFAKFQSDAPSCSNCGAITVRNGNCYLCHNCGTSHGCS